MENSAKTIYNIDMNKLLYNMLKNSAKADRDRALLSLELLGNEPVGVGDHTSKDLWDDAETALALLESAESRLEALERHYKDTQ